MAYGMYHIGEEELPGGYTIEWEYDPDTESPRTFDNLGHMYCWGGRIVSPDENPYRDECEFVKNKLLELFTGRELEKAVRDGMFGSLRFAVGEDGAEHLESLCVSTVAGPSWYPVDDWEEWRDEQELAEAIADCPEAVELLSRKMVILTVYRLEHSGVAYSTRLRTIPPGPTGRPTPSSSSRATSRSMRASGTSATMRSRTRSVRCAARRRLLREPCLSNRKRAQRGCIRVPFFFAECQEGGSGCHVATQPRPPSPIPAAIGRHSGHAS